MHTTDPRAPCIDDIQYTILVELATTKQSKMQNFQRRHSISIKPVYIIPFHSKQIPIIPGPASLASPIFLPSQMPNQRVVVVTVLITVDLDVAPVTVAVETVTVAVLGTLVTNAEQALDKTLAGYLVNPAGVETAEATARLDSEDAFNEGLEEEILAKEEDEEEDEALIFKVVVVVTVDTGILVLVAVTYAFKSL